MIYSYNSSEQTLASNAEVVYAVDVVETGVTATHTPGTSVFSLNKPGYYYITVTATASATASATDPISISLYNGPTQIAGANASALSQDATDAVNLTINAIIPVRPSCCAIDNTVTLIVVNTGIEAVFDNTTITITKLA